MCLRERLKGGEGGGGGAKPERERDRDRETETERDRQTDRQKERQADRDGDHSWKRVCYKSISGKTQSVTQRHRETCVSRQTN